MDTRFSGFGPLYAACLITGFVGTFLDLYEYDLDVIVPTESGEARIERTHEWGNLWQQAQFGVGPAAILLIALLAAVLMFPIFRPVRHPAYPLVVLVLAGLGVLMILTATDRSLASGGQVILGTSVALGLVALGHLVTSLIVLLTRSPAAPVAPAPRAG